MYIYMYIHTYKLAQNRTAVIKISYKQLFLLCWLQLLLTVCVSPFINERVPMFVVCTG